MSLNEFDIAIIGGGCIGSSILHELSRRHFNNIVLIDHGRKNLSATANSGGMLRVFHESLEHIDLALAHQDLLESYCQSQVRSEKNHPPGSLYFFNKARFHDYKTNLHKMEQAKYPFEILTRVSGAQRFAQFHWGPDEWAIYEPRGTHLCPRIFVNDLLVKSIQQGASIFDNFEVRRICPYRDRFRISGDQSMITTKMLILAGGARLLPLFQDLGLPLPLTRKTLITHLAEKTQDDFFIPNYFDRERLEFGRFGHGRHIVLSNPQTARVDEKKWGAIIEQRSAEDCYSPNRLGFSGQVPGYPGLFLATGWGGTAFKFALEVGNRVANAIEYYLAERKIINAQL